jgi:hypothetical protein
VRALSLARVLFAFLAFQLALGLQVGVAYAVAEPVVSTDAAPMQMPMPSAVHKNSDGAATAASSDDACLMHKSTEGHDCCKSSGCQCQCGNAPLAFNVTAVRGVSATAIVQPIRAIGPVVAPSDTHFRPPIAS